MTTRLDDGPEDPEGFGPDDPLAVILRPPSDHLGPPVGRYEAIRRGAARRRLFRAAAGAGAVCAVAALVALPIRLTSPDDPPVSPTVPLDAPPTTRRSTPPPPSAAPTPSPAPESRTARPDDQTSRPGSPDSLPSASAATPSVPPPTRPAPGALTTPDQRSEPSEAPTDARATHGSG